MNVKRKLAKTFYIRYIYVMVKESHKFDTFPVSRILPRLILGVAEAGISIYLVIDFKMNFGLAFSAYWIFSMLVLLPFIRCTKCYYYGKRCNTGWGLLAAFMFPKGEARYFQAGYALTFILWPLRLLPIAIGLLGLIGGIKFMNDGLFAIYILIILLHRLYYRKANCPRCHQQEVCPVYNPHIMIQNEKMKSV